jgi:aminopeptidase
MQTPTDFETNLRQYAQLIVKEGLNLQQGQRLRIGASIQAVPLVRHVAIAAYQAGARFVDVIWTDGELDLIRLEHAAPKSLHEFPQWRLESRMEYARRDDATLVIRATRSELFDGQDVSQVRRMLLARARTLRPFQEMQVVGEVNWLGVVVPTVEWASKLFPGLFAEAGGNQSMRTSLEFVYRNAIG